MVRGENKNKIKKFLKKFWQIVWKDDSFKGWLISLIFIFLVIYFIFLPLLELATGTSLPLAIVESCSMYHSGNVLGNFNDWWTRHESKYSNFNIENSEFKEFPLKKGFSKGDIIFIIRAKPEKLKVGDVIIFDGGEKNPIIHRIINIRIEKGNYIFSTIGDNNHSQLPSEISITEEQLVGKAALNMLPSLGWIKLVFYEPFMEKNKQGFCHEN